MFFFCHHDLWRCYNITNVPVLLVSDTIHLQLKIIVYVIQVMERPRKMRHLSVQLTLFRLLAGSITLRWKLSVKDEMGMWRIECFEITFCWKTLNVHSVIFCWCGSGLYNGHLGFILAPSGADVALCKSFHLLMPL